MPLLYGSNYKGKKVGQPKGEVLGARSTAIPEGDTGAAGRGAYGAEDVAALQAQQMRGGPMSTAENAVGTSQYKTALKNTSKYLPSGSSSRMPAPPPLPSQRKPRTVGGKSPNSFGGYYGKSGRDTSSTSSYGTDLAGTLGGRNVITGGQGSRVDRTAGIPGDPLSRYMEALSPETVIDRQKRIRNELAKERQQQIDAIERSAQSAVQSEQAAGAEDLARQRSMNLRAGLGGSDFGAAAKSQVRDRTNQRVQAIEAGRDIEIGNAMNTIEQLAQSRFSEEQGALQQGFSNMFQYEQYTGQQQQAARKQAVESIAELGKSGLDIQTIKERDPQLYENLTAASGMGEVELEAVLNNNKPAPAKIDYQTIVRGGKIMMFGVDPTTGTMKMIEQEVDMPDNYKTLQADDGTILGIPEDWDGDTSKIVTVGNYRKPLASELNGGGSVLGGTYTPGADPVVDSWASQIQMGKAKLSDLTGNPALKSKVVVALDGMSGGQLTAVQSNIQEAKKIVDELVTHPGRKFATGVSSVLVNPLSTEAKDFKAKVERLNALLFLNAIPQMRGMGQLTEREGAKLESSSSITREFGVSEGRYLEELKRLQANLGSAYKNIGGGTETGQDDIDAFLNSI